MGAGRRNEAGGGEGAAAADDQLMSQNDKLKVPATSSCENGTRAWKGEQIEW